MGCDPVRMDYQPYLLCAARGGQAGGLLYLCVLLFLQSARGASLLRPVPHRLVSAVFHWLWGEKDYSDEEVDCCC